MVAIDQPRASKPSGCGLFTRIVDIHQALSLAFFIAAVRAVHRQGAEQILLPHLYGIFLSVAVLLAVFEVSSRLTHNLGLALRDLVNQGHQALGRPAVADPQEQPELVADLRGMWINELIAIPIAPDWSRPVHKVDLASFRGFSGPP